MPDRRLTAALMGDGTISVIEQDIPPVNAGEVLVQVKCSLVSPGTELGGWRGLRRRMDEPDPDAKPRPFGYQNAGVVLEVGAGVEGLKPGDPVACMGAGYAQHTTYSVVPHNLCVPIPEGVTFAQAAYNHLAATALHALRRGEPQLGDATAILGLGVVGQLAAMLYKLAGSYVIGWDMIPLRNEIAAGWGIDATVLVGEDDPVAATRAFTRDYGLDGAVMAFGGSGDAALESLTQCMKLSPDGHRMGTVVVVGGTSFTYPSTTTNMDIRKSSRTGAGYHDEAWERGPDYPPVFMRWTTRTNVELCLRLIAQKRLDVDCLTTHTVPLEQATERIAAIMEAPDSAIGVVFEMGA